MIYRLAFFTGFMLLLASSVLAQSSCRRELDQLKMTVEVAKANGDSNGASESYLHVTLRAHFENRSDSTLLLLRLNKGANSVGVLLYGRNQNGYYPIQESLALPSNCPHCEDSLGKDLDRRDPSESSVLTLKPGESSAFDVEERINLIGQAEWNEVERNNKKIYGRLVLTMFPYNLASYKKNFGHSLQRRWLKSGILYYCDTQSILRSEPFLVDPNGVKFAH